MKKAFIVILLLAFSFSSCSDYQKLYKSTDYEFKYEVAKEYYTMGEYLKAATVLNDIISFLKGSDNGEDAVFMLGMAYLRDGDYNNAATAFRQYYLYYPRGMYAELSRFYTGKALYGDVPEFELDQTSTYNAISEFQVFIEYYPQSVYRPEAERLIFELQDQLARKEYSSAYLYYNLGTYLGNNYLSCVITAQNALKEYPYTKYREDLSLLVVKAKYEMAKASYETLMADRLRDAVDECYSFKNEYEDSTHLEEVDAMLKYCEQVIETLPQEE